MPMCLILEAWNVSIEPRHFLQIHENNQYVIIFICTWVGMYIHFYPTSNHDYQKMVYRKMGSPRLVQ